MPTPEFTFQGGRATITTETGGDENHPDWNVEVDADHMGLSTEAAFAAEILRLSARIAEIEGGNPKRPASTGCAADYRGGWSLE